MEYNRALDVAISNYLSWWDDDLTNDEILTAISNEDWDSVTIWEPFEHYDGDYVANHITALADDIFNASKEEQNV